MKIFTLSIAAAVIGLGMLGAGLDHEPPKPTPPRSSSRSSKGERAEPRSSPRLAASGAREIRELWVRRARSREVDLVPGGLAAEDGHLALAIGDPVEALTQARDQLELQLEELSVDLRTIASDTELDPDDYERTLERIEEETDELEQQLAALDVLEQALVFGDDELPG